MLFRIELELAPGSYLLWVAFRQALWLDVYVFQPLWVRVSDPGPLDADV